MPKRFSLTRWFPVAMTKDGYRKLKGFAREASQVEGKTRSFLFEKIDSVTAQENLSARWRLFNVGLETRKRRRCGFGRGRTPPAGGVIR